MGRKKSYDVAPYNQAAASLAKGAVDGAGAFLSRICLPAAEELGLLFRDRVHAWRKKHAVKIALEAERLLGDSPGLHAHPRLVTQIMEHGSWSDDDTVQQMWAGLLASSCSSDGRDESNLMFIHLLGQLTSTEVRILKFACQKASVILTPAGWLEGQPEIVTVAELTHATGLTDEHRMDREMDHLRALGLLTLNAGFRSRVQEKVADITPSAIGLHLYARSHGHRGSPEEFFGLGRGAPQALPKARRGNRARRPSRARA